jgi:hypothetical protein
VRPPESQLLALREQRFRHEQAREDRDKWIRAFNRLEKAVTNHIANRCIDSDDLAHVHKAIMRDLGPQ